MKKILILLMLFTTVISFAEEQLILLSGTTMRFAVEELTAEFEKNHDVKIEISYGGSGSLLKLIQENKVGDLFLPGSDSYIKKMKDSGEVSKTAAVGFNQAALIVATGNPLGINCLKDLANPNYGVVIARSDSGSIGKEASKILKAQGLEEQVLDNVLYLTTDSKDIDAALKDGIADVTINWNATSTWSQNEAYMDAIAIPSASKKALVFGLLKYSRNKQMAEQFIDFANTQTAKMIFERHGF